MRVIDFVLLKMYPEVNSTTHIISFPLEICFTCEHITGFEWECNALYLTVRMHQQFPKHFLKSARYRGDYFHPNS